MTDAQLLLFIERLEAGEVHPDEFGAFTIDDARHLSYLLRQGAVMGATIGRRGGLL